MATLTAQQQADIRNLFDGYRSVSTETQNMFLDWLFEGGTSGVFESLEVTGDASIGGDLAVTGLISTEDNLLVQGTSIFESNVSLLKNITIGQTLNVTGTTNINGLSNFAMDAEFDQDVLVNGKTTTTNFETTGLAEFLNMEVSGLMEVGLGGAGVAIQISDDPEMQIAWSAFTPGRELYMLNQNAEGVVIVAGGSGAGTGTTMIGGAGDKLGFFNGGVSAVKQTLPLAPPADLAEAITQIGQIKAAGALYALWALG